MNHARPSLILKKCTQLGETIRRVLTVGHFQGTERSESEHDADHTLMWGAELSWRRKVHPMLSTMARAGGFSSVVSQKDERPA